MRQSSVSDEDVAVFKPVISTYQPVLFSSQMKHMTTANNQIAQKEYFLSDESPGKFFREEGKSVKNLRQNLEQKSKLINVAVAASKVKPRRSLTNRIVTSPKDIQINNPHIKFHQDPITSPMSSNNEPVLSSPTSPDEMDKGVQASVRTIYSESGAEGLDSNNQIVMFARPEVIGGTFSNTMNPYIYQTGMLGSGSQNQSNDEEEHQNQQQYFQNYNEDENSDIIEDQIMKARKRRQKLKVDFKFTDHQKLFDQWFD